MVGGGILLKIGTSNITLRELVSVVRILFHWF